MLEEIKRKIAFHQSQIKRFSDFDENQKSFHQGAVMAFSEFKQFLEQAAAESNGLKMCEMHEIYKLNNGLWACKKCSWVQKKQMILTN
jgi:hypothetical protein